MQPCKWFRIVIAVVSDRSGLRRGDERPGPESPRAFFHFGNALLTASGVIANLAPRVTLIGPRCPLVVCSIGLLEWFAKAQFSGLGL